MQETQAIFSSHGYKFDYRGVVSVKGKGSLITYFAPDYSALNDKTSKSKLLSW